MVHLKVARYHHAQVEYAKRLSVNDSKQWTEGEQRARHVWYDPKLVSIAVLPAGAGETSLDILIIPFFERDTPQPVTRKRSKASVAPVL